MDPTHACRTVLYIFLSLILLLNLLIALLGNTFRRTTEEATLHARMAFARVVLRLELVAARLCINTHAGEHTEDGRYVHSFRSIVRDRNGELMSDYKDENVFDLSVLNGEPDAETKPLRRLASATKAASRPAKRVGKPRVARDASPTPPLVVRHSEHPVISPDRDLPAVNGNLAA